MNYLSKCDPVIPREPQWPHNQLGPKDCPCDDRRFESDPLAPHKRCARRAPCRRKENRLLRKIAIVILLVIASSALWTAHAQKPPKPESAVSEIAVNTGNGFGSAGIFARRFLNVDVATGSDITYTQDATNGDSFSINTTGIYAISYTDFSWPGDTFSISLNSDPATEITGLQPGNRLCSSSMDPGHLQNCSVTLKLDAGDVIRAHRSAGAIGASDTSPFVRFIIVKIQ